jgi:hypothetical protein
LGAAWQAATEAEARAWGLSGYGFDPIAGGCRVDAGAVSDWDGGWYQAIDPARPEGVYQACKYPTPVTELGPEALAEFLAVAFRRRWQDGAGAFRRVRARAKELAADAWALDAVSGAGRSDVETVKDAESVDLGVNLAWMAPSLVPKLGQVAPELGLEARNELARPADTGRVYSWRLTAAPTPEVQAAILEAGGDWQERASTDGLFWYATLPSSWTTDTTRKVHARLRRRRLAVAEIRRPPG